MLVRPRGDLQQEDGLVGLQDIKSKILHRLDDIGLQDIWDWPVNQH